MKDKLTKKNIKKVDYAFRRFGSCGCAIFIMALAIILPVANNLHNNNVALINEIEHLENQKENFDVIEQAHTPIKIKANASFRIEGLTHVRVKY